MSRQDRQRWDEKWAALNGEVFEPHPLLVSHVGLLRGGRALDLACGRGQNAIWLAQHDYQVLAVDISPAALAAARAEAERQGLAGRVRFEEADLTAWTLPVAAFDLICVFRFLERGLFPAIRSGLKPGGLLFYATRHVGVLADEPAANPAYLLERGELAREFGDWQVLHHRETAAEAELAARKPDGEGAR